MALTVNFLIVLVAFASQHDHVVGRSRGDHLRDRGAAASNEADF